jgi:energy-coupling factor transport system permease protein
MYWLSAGFLFKRVASPFNRLDPRVRLLVAMEFFVLALLSSTLAAVALVLFAILLVAGVAKSLRRIGKTVAFSGFFAAFIFAVNFLFGLGFLVALLYSLRFLAIIASTSLFFVTTSPDELEQIMKWMRVPRDVVFAFVTAVRFIPVVMLDAFQIMDAQKSRGLEFERGNVVRRVRNLVPILIPLVVNSVIRSGELAEAMESRAYGSTPKPTSLYGMRLRWYDLAVVFGSLLLFFAAAFYIYHFVSFRL